MNTISSPSPAPEHGAKYWRSLDELADTPEFREWADREFPEGATEFTDPVNRRHFVKIMSASFLLAGMGLTGCRRPEENIMPFSKMPENYVHGVPQYFATSMPTRGSAIPLVVKSHEGRPTKIEGNAEHPMHQLAGEDASTTKHGATDLFAQASILNLYDPDRAQRFTRKGENVSREVALDFLAQTAREAEASQGRGLCFLLERGSSPSRERLQKLISAKYPQARWFVYEPVDFDVHGQAATLAFGQPVKPSYKLETARRVLSLDSDFLASEEDAHRLIRGFARSRRLRQSGDEMSRLYVVESLFTLTGASADHRLRLPASQVFPLTCLLVAEFITQTKADETNDQIREFKQSLLKFADGVKAHQKWAGECVKDLITHGGRSVVIPGYRQPAEVHLLAQALNFHLGAAGVTVDYLPSQQATEGTLSQLAKGLNAGEVETLVVLGGNPVYNAPGDLDWAKAQAKAKTVIRLGYYEDETFGASTWHLPLAHYLEAWGDTRTGDGSVAPVQPLIQPLFGGLTELEVLARLGGLASTSPHEIARDTFKERSPENFSEDNWKKFLHDGFLAGSAAKPVKVEFKWDSVAPVVLAAKAAPAPTPHKLDLVFQRDHSVDDGRYNNNGWLQELPDPITKITWDNVFQFSQKTAADLGIKVEDQNKLGLRTPIVRVTVGGRSIEGPAWIQPGLADNVVAVTLGYGRSAPGRVGRGTGFNAYPLVASATPTIALGADVQATGGTYPISCTQNHWSMEGRPIIREANLEEYKAKGHFAKEMDLEEPPIAQPMYPNPLDVPNKDGVTPKQDATHWWGMSVDLNACVGCSACMIACQSENNIPIVGKDQVNRNREMHWIRIDRYFTGTVADPQVVNQPMMCQHCEAAPCESVCPVNATVHDNEGLNLMVYNRCVGTRYCSNNCAWKVRRFNFFDYNRRPIDRLYKSPLVTSTDGEWEVKRWWKNPDRGSRKQDEWDLLKLAKNPDVTVRMRGVMEKCTYCIQRIEQAKISQKVKAGASGNVEVPDGGVKTACQQACPAEAIAFGNIKDPNSLVSQAKAMDRTYTVMEFLATKPRTTYMARVRNPNPAMPDYYATPLSAKEYTERGFDSGGEAHTAPGAESTHEAGADKKGAH